MKTSSRRVRAGVSLRYWFQTCAAILGKEERGGNVEAEDDGVGFEGFEGVGSALVEDWVCAVREGVVVVLGVLLRTEPVAEAGFLAILIRRRDFEV